MIQEAPREIAPINTIQDADKSQNTSNNSHKANGAPWETREHPLWGNPDLHMKKEIEDELCWDPQVNKGRIGGSVDNGVVSLFGTVDTYTAERAANEAAERVNGVCTVTQELMVRALPDRVRSDADIAASVRKTLDSNVCVPATVTTKVERGSVTLEGQVTWKYEREAAERAICHLTGVIAVHNFVIVKSQTSAAQVKECVLVALQQQTAADALSIHVETQGTQVTLTGYASTWQAIVDASTAAWAAPGVTQVFDHVNLSR